MGAIDAELALLGELVHQLLEVRRAVARARVARARARCGGTNAPVSVSLSQPRASWVWPSSAGSASGARICEMRTCPVRSALEQRRRRVAQRQAEHQQRGQQLHARRATRIAAVIRGEREDLVAQAELERARDLREGLEQLGHVVAAMRALVEERLRARSAIRW
jgi:hypothetical protein